MEKYLSSKEAAQMAGVTPDAIAKARKAGTLKAAVQVGRSYGFAQEEVERWAQWRLENPPESRSWGWGGSGVPRPKGVEYKSVD